MAGTLTTTVFPAWIIGELKAKRRGRVEEHLNQMPKRGRQALLDESLLDAHKRGWAGVVKDLVDLGAQVQLILGPGWVVGQLELGHDIGEHLPVMTPEERQALLDQSLFEAATRKLLAAAKALVQMGAKLTVRDKKGRHGLGIAIDRWVRESSGWHARIARALTPACQDPNEHIAGAPLLAWGCTDEEWLIANGADPNGRSEDGRPIVHWAARYQDKFELLHTAGADMLAVDRDGRTVLHAELAAANVNSEMLEFFLGLGLDRADPSWFMAANACDDHRWRPQMQSLLLDHGFPMPLSLPIEAYRFSESFRSPELDRLRAAFDKTQLDHGTIEVEDSAVGAGDCPRCGRSAHSGGCRF